LSSTKDILSRVATDGYVYIIIVEMSIWACWVVASDLLCDPMVLSEVLVYGCDDRLICVLDAFPIEMHFVLC